MSYALTVCSHEGSAQLDVLGFVEVKTAQPAPPPSYLQPPPPRLPLPPMLPHSPPSSPKLPSFVFADSACLSGDSQQRVELSEAVFLSSALTVCTQSGRAELNVHGFLA
eukprot:3666921-Pleurochrysis_carterae.AAC.2